MLPIALVSVRGLCLEQLDTLFVCASKMRDLVATVGGCNSCSHKVAALFFSEPSTRTSASFQAAMQRLGGTVVPVNSVDSSIKKGESFEDTIMTLSCYCDILIMRHPEKGSAAKAMSLTQKPVINAGDGAGEHPTQALLDVFTIYNEFGRVGGTSVDEPMVVTVLGDLRNGRTVHSLVLLLALYPHMRILLVAPAGLELPAEIIEEVQDRVDIHVSTLEEAIAVTDVLYVTRIQKERFAREKDYMAVMGSYCVDAALMTKAKEKMIVMHPLPRTGEIAVEVDADPRAAYIRQMENGMYVRMAILQDLLLR